MKNIFKSFFLILCCLAASVNSQGATPIADLNFEITSATTEVPSNYVYSASNSPKIKTQNGVTCIIISDGGGSTAPTFNDPDEPSGGKRWMAFCPAVDCSAVFTVMSNKKEFFIQNKEGKFFTHTLGSNETKDLEVTGLKAGVWYAMCGGSSQVYIIKAAFTASGSTPSLSNDATLKSLTYNGTAVPGFSPSTLSYEVTLPKNSEKPVVTAVANHSNATVQITENQAENIPYSFTIHVTAEDGQATKDYLLNFKFEGDEPIDPDPPVNPPTPSGNALFHWQMSGTEAPANGTVLTATGGTLSILSSTTKTFGVESAVYASGIPEDMQALDGKGLKCGGDAIHMLAKLTEGSFQAGDTVYLCGYNKWTISSTDSKDGDLVASFGTGTSKTDYQIAFAVLPSNANELYFSRATNTSPCVAAIKICRPGGSVTPGLSSDATLKSLTYGNVGTSVPNFNPNTLNYTVVFSAWPTPSTLTVYAEANDPKAKVEIQQAEFVEGQASTAYITVTAEDGTQLVYSVTFKGDDEHTIVPVTGILLNMHEATIEVDETLMLTATIEPSDATDKSVEWSTSKWEVASVGSGLVTGKAEGVAIISVKTKDGNFEDACTVTVTPKQTPPQPQGDYTTHAPEIYEEPKANKGYGGTLSSFNNREYEVYYICRDASGSGISVAVEPEDKVAGITTGTATSVKANDNWFELKECGGKGGDSNAGVKDEFKFASLQSVKMRGGQEFIFQVKGFDQFSFYGKDNNKDASKGKHFEVYIDDVKQASDPIDGYAIHRFDMTTKKHTIRLVGIGDGDSKLTGFSLRVSEEPLVRFLSGNKDQEVYQTKNMEPVTFRVRRAQDKQLKWAGSAVPGIELEEGLNDTVRVKGVANAAVGQYTYRLVALDKSGAEASEETGTLTIATHINNSKQGNNAVVNIAEPMKTLDFVFYALNKNDIKLQWGNKGAVSGLSLTFRNDSVCSISGTPAETTDEGYYPYTITANGGNTVSGEITVVVPGPIFETVPLPDQKVRNGQTISWDVVVRHANKVTATGLPNGLNVTYNSQTSTCNISGRVNISGPFPKTLNYTLTAEPRYAGKEDATAEGNLIVIDPNAKALLLACKNLANISDDAVAQYLLGEKYDVTIGKQDNIGSANLDAYDFILISENADADNPAILELIRGGKKPVLNMKGFTYSPNRLDWGEPDNGALTQEALSITVERDDHPIFKALNKKRGAKIQVLTNDNEGKKGLMPINIDFPGTHCLATSYTRSIEEYYENGELQTILHEIPAAMRGGNKYICFPMALSCGQNLSNDGKRLLDEIVNYLLNNKQTVEVPSLQITRFAIDGVEGQFKGKDSIYVDIDLSQHPDLDLHSIKPDIAVASSYTHVKPMVPEHDGYVDFSTSTLKPVPYVVTDYINRRVYEVILHTYRSEGIEEVYTVGEWVNIFDIFGRKIATTNENIYTMSLPHGVYMIVTENGQTAKILK